MSAGGSGPVKLKTNFNIDLNAAASTGSFAAGNATLSGQDASVSLSEIRYWIGNVIGTSPYALT
jgi:hypothetical protein